MSEANDFRVTITIRNGRLWRAIREAGFDTTSAFCKAFGLPTSPVYEYLGLKVPPYRADGKLRSDVERLCDALSMNVTELFPPSFLEKALAKNSVTVEMSEAQALAVMDNRPKTPEEVMLLMERRKQIRTLLGTLSPRDRTVIELRYGIHTGHAQTLDEVAPVVNVGRARVGQIEARAIDRMRDNMAKAQRRGIALS